MIVKNEEQTIGRCLDSVKKIVDEIIIVDTGSSDNTKKILKNYNCKIFDFVWCDDFSKARNFSFSKATGDYIMWLDADDIVPKRTINRLLKIKDKLSADVYMLKYDIAFNGEKSTFSYYRERIIKNCENAIWRGVVHECIAPFGIIKKLDLSVEHHKIKATDPKRNLKIYENLKKIAI